MFGTRPLRERSTFTNKYLNELAFHSFISTRELEKTPMTYRHGHRRSFIKVEMARGNEVVFEEQDKLFWLLNDEKFRGKERKSLLFLFFVNIQYARFCVSFCLICH